MKNITPLIRAQLSQTLKKLSPLTSFSMPAKGWVVSIRTALGMNTRQLAKRIGVARQRISEIEKGELLGNVTIKTMKKTAEALNCKFVYCLLPNTSLDDTIKKQAEHIVIDRMNHVRHSMLLEKQALSDNEMKKSIDNAVQNILRDSPKSIWE